MSSVVPDSITSLLCVEFSGEPRGYKIWVLLHQLSSLELRLLICPICGGMMRDPSLSMGKTLCRSCCSLNQESGEEAPGHEEMRRAIAELPAVCPLSDRNCPWQGHIEGIEDHLEVCGMFRVSCPSGCTEVIERRSLDQHKQLCPRTRFVCEYCDLRVDADYSNQHLAECDAHPKPCPAQCGQRVSRRNLSAHLSNQCPRSGSEGECSFARYGCKTPVYRHEGVEGHSEGCVVSHLEGLRVGMEQMEHEGEIEFAARRQATEELSEKVRKQNETIEELKAQNADLMERLTRLEVVVTVQDEKLTEFGRGFREDINMLSQQTASSRCDFGLRRFFPEKNKELQGVEWNVRDVAEKLKQKETKFPGPAFYLGLWKLHCLVYSGSMNLYFYIKRLQGEFDQGLGPCEIRFKHTRVVNRTDDAKSLTHSSVQNATLEVGDEMLAYCLILSKTKSAGLIKDDSIVVQFFFELPEA